MDTLFIPLLERIASTINAAGVRYMVIGGQAVIQYGESRLTEDIDITIGIDAGDWRRADALLRTADLIPRTANYEMLAEQGHILLLADRTTSIRVDCALTGSRFEEAALARVVPQRIGAVDVTFTSPEDLVIQKIFAGRERDHDDVRRLLRKQKNLDREYIEGWLRDFGVSTDQDLVAEFRRLT